MIINQTLALNIRRIRDDQHLGLTGACKESGLTRRQWCDLEAARGNPTLRILSVVAYSLNVEVIDLLKPNTKDETY